MRGRSLLRDTSSPSICAFCAHRLAQARNPSHVQQRFLQSSWPAYKPPVEATALKEDASKPPQPTWGRPSAAGGRSPAPSWGRPSTGVPGMPSRPVPSWGSPMVGVNGTTGGAREHAGSNTDDLLPHERVVRERMLEQHTKSQARPLQKHVGPGPQSTRAGRPEPQRSYGMLDSMKSEQGRRPEPQRSYGMFDSPKSEQAKKKDFETKAINGSGPRISKIFAEGNRKWGYGSKDDGSRSDRDSVWGQLRIKTDRPAPEIDSRMSKLVESRSEREAESKTMGYKPLTVSYKPIFDNSTTTLGGGFKERDKPTWGQGLGTRMTELSKQIPDKSATFVESQQRDFKPLQPIANNKAHQKEYFEEGEGREDRKRKARARRGVTEKEPFVGNLPRGKDRDKAKRRQQFARTAADDDEADASAARAEAKRLRKLERAAEKALQSAAPTPMFLPEFISVSNLAVALKVKFEDFVEKMEDLGFQETAHDHILNAETAGLIAQEYNFEPIIERGESEDLKPRDPAPDPSILPPRAPVVTIMGHVDHGKTTLLDYLRKSSVAATEHGGITQHIGAFSVPMLSGKTITFLDTPGHAAFLSMRQRGANVTDIVILVVAADDSVKPQTIEAINHAKAAKVPMIVAINKIDKDETNIERVKQDLARHGVDIEDFGGDAQVVCVSGKTGQGMEDLEEAVVTLSEILDMRAEKDGPAEGWVIEASVKSVGKVATILVRRGTMRPGDFIVAGQTWARIRCLRNEAGIEIDEAGPGTPVEIDGWREQPLAGDEVLQAPDETKAKSVVDFRLEKAERDKMAEDMEAVNEYRKAEQEKRDREKAEKAAEKAAKLAREEAPEKYVPTKASGPKEVYFVVKGDVSGSVEAVIDEISSIGNKEVQPHILRSGVGQVSEFDIEHAAAAKGLIINFNTEIDPHISRLAAEAKVKILDYNIIYQLVDDVKLELSKHLPPIVTQRVTGEAEIAQVFSITVKGRQQKAIAGCKIRNGAIGKNAKVRVLRNGEKVFEGMLASLKNAKKDITESKKGTECGMGFEDWFDFQVGDQVQSYEEKEEERYL